ncbi:hypothetical protein GCM10023238_05840 [Streptomyces heliomycini]
MRRRHRVRAARVSVALAIALPQVNRVSRYGCRRRGQSLIHACGLPVGRLQVRHRRAGPEGTDSSAAQHDEVTGPGGAVAGCVILRSPGRGSDAIKRDSE